MRDLFPGMTREEREEHRDARCGSCRWYDGLFDCCSYPWWSATPAEGKRCVRWTPDQRARSREP